MQLPSMNLEGKTAIITGAGRGIGKSLALGLGAAGANVVAVSRTQEQVDEVASELRSMGHQALALSVDVTVMDSLQVMVEKTLEAFGKIDILVNNAGVTVKKPAEDVTENDWDTVINTNLKGMFFCAQAVGRQMIKQRSGSIINLSSIGSKVAISNSVAYCASKGGLAQVTRVLAVEWAKYNIRVNAVGPAYIETPLLKWIKDQPEAYGRITGRTPMGRMGHPDEIIGAVLYLASDASSYVTGETIFVDGGLLAYGI
ncbi:hypothetical protein SY88_20430 [Clostridiales bacterium PH28_bin88]|nr:hypothetical protein SY88_20430 [Clostridiales bacterium PH28_bin88]